MLPSADAAMLAFAEVTSFVRFYADNAGRPGAARSYWPSCAQQRPSANDDEALVAASGADRKTWDARWRAYVASRPREPLPDLFDVGAGRLNGGPAREKLGPVAVRCDKPGNAIARMRELRDRTRLAQLLLSRPRNRPTPSRRSYELDRIDRPRAPSPATRGVGARDGRSKRSMAEGPRSRGMSGAARKQNRWWPIPRRLEFYGPGGRCAAVSRVRGATKAPRQLFLEAFGSDPFNPEAACETVAPEPSPPTPPAAPCATPPVLAPSLLSRPIDVAGCVNRLAPEIDPLQKPRVAWLKGDPFVWSRDNRAAPRLSCAAGVRTHERRHLRNRPDSARTSA